MLFLCLLFYRLSDQERGQTRLPVLHTRLSVASLPFRKGTLGNRVVVVIVVGIAGVVMQRPCRARGDALFQFFHIQYYLVFHAFFVFVVLPAIRSGRMNWPAFYGSFTRTSPNFIPHQTYWPGVEEDSELAIMR
jgi:hypothetical protein